MGLDLIYGAKGGGSAHTPVEARDTLRSISYFQIEDALSEGEIGGLVNGLQSVKLDGTPVANADGTLNFSGVSVQLRTGTQSQSSIPGYGSVSNEIGISVELKAETPWVRAVDNVQLSAVAITLQVDSLQKSDTSNGDINGYLITYAIDVSTDGGAYQTILTNAFNGKASNPYQRTHRIDLPKAVNGWNVRVRRLTPNANSATVSDTTRIISMTEIIDAKLRYPNTAYVAISGDASQFSNIPARSYVCWGRLIRVPSNYDPQTRAYNGVWDGSFKVSWTDNPAWILYDMIVNERFGLGAMIDASLVDKWELYRIAQYCDQLVPDGKGGTEPRYRCTVYLQTQTDAFRLLGDLASVFNGVSYWMGNTITTVADMPADPVYTYTAANVIDGRFTYQSSARKTRFSAALVTYSDPTNTFKPVPEYVPVDEAIARYGLQQTEFAAFGCTSQGQAHRRGKWAVLTSLYETDSVTFAVGLEGIKAAPGQYIRVQDPKRAGLRQAGRLRSATVSQVTVDQEPGEVKVGDTLTVHLPEGVAQTRTISAIDGRVLTVGQPFTEAPVPTSIWAVESETLQTQTFRVLNVRDESTPGKIVFTISAVQHNASKFAAIDNGAQIQIPPISKLPVGTQVPPANVRISSHVVIEQGIANNVMTIEWTAAEGAASYKVEWQKDNGQWIQAGTVSTTSLDVIGVYTGTYIARVTAFSNGNVASIAAYSVATAVEGKTGTPPTLASLTAASLPFGIALDWTFPPNTEDSQRTEIWANTVPIRPDAEDTNAYKLGDYAYPGNHTELHGLAGGASLFFWGRIVDKAGNVGPFYPTAGAVNGQTISDPNDPALQAYWAGLIGRSALTEQLLSDIDAASQFGQYVNAPDWAAGNAYETGDIVGHGDFLWRAVHAIAAGGPEPGTDATAWENIGNIVQTAYGQAAQIHDTTLAVTQLDDQVQSVASQVDALEVSVGPPVKAGDDTTPAGANTRIAGIYTYSVVQVNDDLAEAQKTETLSAQIGGYTAAIQTIADAQATLDGKVSASYVIKTQVAANGQRYMAGIAIGVDYSGGDVTSQVVVNAGTFSVINATDGSVPVTYPFVIQGGQVFISQALIGQGWITDAMIGNQIKSTALTSGGQSVWEINKTGTRYLRGEAFTLTEDVNGQRWTNNANGVVVIEIGMLT